jgi:starvation-inducible outer membrane lipoprotein
MEILTLLLIGLALQATGIVIARVLGKIKPIIYLGLGITVIGVIVTLAAIIWYFVTAF